MKYALMTAIIAALITVFVLIQLGARWIYEGYGVNPWLCGGLSLVILFLAYRCAYMLERLEDEDYDY